jgi:hypothetical protein
VAEQLVERDFALSQVNRAIADKHWRQPSPRCWSGRPEPWTPCSQSTPINSERRSTRGSILPIRRAPM